MSYSKADVRAKVDWEGSVQEAIEWGIKHADITDARLRMLWKHAEKACEEFSRFAQMVEEYLEEE